TTGTARPKIKKVISGEEISRLQELVREVSISDALIAHVGEIVRASRPGTSALDYVREWVEWGAGPRAGQAMILTAKANALLQGRLAVSPADIRAVAPPVLRHRILVNFRAEAAGIHSDEVTRHILDSVQPKDR